MKILLTVFSGRPLTKRERCRAAWLLARRKAALERVGCEARCLWVTGDLEQLAARCREHGADGLWMTVADGGGSLRRQWFRSPALLEGLAVYADGVVSQQLPPTPGQLRQLTSMGITYLGERAAPLIPLLLEYA